MLPEENFFKIRWLESISEAILDPKSHVLQFLANRISVGALCAGSDHSRLCVT